MADPRSPLDHINELMEEEHRLQHHEPSGGLDKIGHARLREIEVELDQYWDLLRQRRARRDAGESTDDAALRSPGVVEGYQQ
jgi:Protein of unknown function (DUF2630)